MKYKTMFFFQTSSTNPWIARIYKGKLDGNWRAFVTRRLTTTELSIPGQPESVQTPARRRIGEHVTATARNLRNLTAHEVLNLAGHVLVAHVIMTELPIRAGAESKHPSVLINI